MPKREVKTKFFTFSQNNSGGGFREDAKAGIGHYVIIEALDADHANRRAEDIGLYFGGQGDCPCCGDRWSEAWSGDGKDKPCIYEQDVSGGKYKNEWVFSFTPKESYIHYLDGTIKTVVEVKKEK